MRNSTEPKEVWKDITGCEGIYKVSDCGNVKSFKFDKERILRPGKDEWGYLLIGLHKKGVRKTICIHRLVALAFVPNPDNLSQVNHKDKDPSNNNYWNLEWVTSIENSTHKFIGKNTSSKYCGVHFYKITKKWKAQILFNGKRKHLGYFENELEAYQSRINFEKENNILNKYL